MENPILLQTKLHRPRLMKDLITRSRLIEQLNHDIDRPLILVCAPAGFGKTTLVSNWLKRLAADPSAPSAILPSAWLSLDENDSDLNLFLRYFIAALRTIFKETCAESLALLHALQQPPPAVLYTTFSNELAELPGEAILVLDDYHTIRGEEVHNLLAELVRHWPRPLHMVLVSRTSPPLPLSSLRARGMLSEIRTRDLRFTAEETAAYLGQSRTLLLSQDALPLLEERFEGWPAGLHLAALSMRSAASQEAVLSTLSSEDTNITGYLVDEVLSLQFPAIRSFLLQTSILDRFCAPLCEAVIGEFDPAWNGGACLEWIERSELFLIPLDDQREWYRYHHLFQEMLQQRLLAEMAPEEVNKLYMRASAWFEEQGLIDEAVHHTLAVSDLDLATRQMNAGLCDVLNRGDRPTLERWLRLLPEDIIEQQPGLLMIKAWALQFLWRVDLQARVIEQIEEMLDTDVAAALPGDDLQLLRGQILVMRAQQAYFCNKTIQAIDLCQQALKLLPPSWTFVRGSGAMLYLSFSMQASGQALAAERLLLEKYQAYSDKDDAQALRLLMPLCFIYLNSGRLEQARRIAKVLLHTATRTGLIMMQNWGDYFPGVVCYLRNELEVAAQHFRQILKCRYTGMVPTLRDATAGIALIHQIQGESTQAWLMVESISQFDLEQTGREDEQTRSLRARLLLMQGDLEGAGDWVDRFTGPPPDRSLLWLEEPQVTRARILVARGADADLRLARQILDVLDEIAERTHNTRYKIEILALRALALEALGETTEANSELKQALELARPGGFIRVFVDLGVPMREMLQQLVEQGHTMELVERILAAFKDDEKYVVSGESRALPRRQQASGESALVEPLTPRELEVMGLLRGPSSIKEIALKLNISYATAKRHTINIYAKLGVNQRWNAVAKAEELNILPPG